MKKNLFLVWGIIYKSWPYLLLLSLFVIIKLLYNNYMAVFDLPVSASEKLLILQKRTDDFFQYACFCYVAAIICTNLIAYKTTHSIWLIAAVFFVIPASYIYSGLLEKTFIFKKQNGFWKGEFSLSFFAIFFYSAIAVIVCLLNLLLLKDILKNKRVQRN